MSLVVRFAIADKRFEARIFRSTNYVVVVVVASAILLYTRLLSCEFLYHHGLHCYSNKYHDRYMPQ